MFKISYNKISKLLVFYDSCVMQLTTLIFFIKIRCGLLSKKKKKNEKLFTILDLLDKSIIHILNN